MARFGKSEQLKCLDGIEKFQIDAQEGNIEVCFAAKIVTQNVFAPINIKVDSYVLAAENDTYYNLSKEDISYLQTSGELPDPLPKYELSSTELFWGSFGIIIFLFVGVGTLKKIIETFLDKKRMSKK